MTTTYQDLLYQRQDDYKHALSAYILANRQEITEAFYREMKERHGIEPYQFGYATTFRHRQGEKTRVDGAFLLIECDLFLLPFDWQPGQVAQFYSRSMEYSSRTYSAFIQYTDSGSMRGFSCSCPDTDHLAPSGYCSHFAASWLLERAYRAVYGPGTGTVEAKVEVEPDYLKDRFDILGF